MAIGGTEFRFRFPSKSLTRIISKPEISTSQAFFILSKNQLRSCEQQSNRKNAPQCQRIETITSQIVAPIIPPTIAATIQNQTLAGKFRAAYLFPTANCPKAPKPN